MASPRLDASNGSTSNRQSSQSNAVDLRENSKTGLVYDVKMRFHQQMDPQDTHPEDPRRIWYIFDKFKTSGCLEKMKRIQTREAREHEILLVHDREHWRLINETSDMSVEELLKIQGKYNSIYLNQKSAFCGRLSCGSTIEICKAVASDVIRNGFAIVRPPGHHAEPDEAQGFCLFNNVAVSVRVIQREYPHIKRILILDWDIHHGNGIQRTFYKDPNVLYISIHRHDNGRFYPSGTYGGADMVGEGEGLGRNVNIPWPSKGMGDADYIHAFQQIVMPIAYEFSPDLVIVSAGFDAAAGDEIGECFVTPPCYGYMTYMLSSLAKGHVVVVLEGGYNLEAIANSALACAKVLLGEPLEQMKPMIPSAVGIETVHQVAKIQSQYWKSIVPKYQPPLSKNKVNKTKSQSKNNDRSLQEVLRSYRQEKLFEEYEMVKVMLSAPRLYETFDSHVIGSADLYENSVLVVNVHQGDDVRGNTMALSNKMLVGDSIVYDSDSMLRWVLENKWAILDINIPESESTVQLGETLILRDSIKDLIMYVWDNFVELSSADTIILVGQGAGCMAICHLITHRISEVTNRVKGVMQMILETPLAMVANRDHIRKWYHQHSMVIVPEDHLVWVSDTKITKKFGSIFKIGTTDEPQTDEVLSHAKQFIKSKIDSIIKAEESIEPMHI